MNPATDADLVIFVLEHIAAAPLSQRAALLRRLAQLVLSSTHRAALLAQAETLDEVAHDHAQLLLELQGSAKK